MAAIRQRRIKNDFIFNKTDKKLSQLFLFFLYLQFITGVALYFFIKPELSVENATMEEIVRNSNLRFWVLEHLATMIFALMLSQIGWILIKNSSSYRNKYKNTIFYYGISLIIILISTSVAMIKESTF